MSLTPPAHPDLVQLAPSLLRGLRESLDRVLGEQGAEILQAAGFESGDHVYDAFADWLRTKTDISPPEDLDGEYLGAVMSEFFSQTGWGELTVERLGASALCIEAPAWAESAPRQSSEIPSCHVTTGLLAAFLGKLAHDTVAVMEVECRTRGDGRCRFLAGSPETLQAVFDGISSGADYETLLTVSAKG